MSIKIVYLVTSFLRSALECLSSRSSDMRLRAMPQERHNMYSHAQHGNKTKRAICLRRTQVLSSFLLASASTPISFFTPNVAFTFVKSLNCFLSLKCLRNNTTNIFIVRKACFYIILFKSKLVRCPLFNSIVRIILEVGSSTYKNNFIFIKYSTISLLLLLSSAW